MKHTTKQILEWDTQASNGKGWFLARAENVKYESWWARIKHAWGVLTGRYDALEWTEEPAIRQVAKNDTVYRKYCESANIMHRETTRAMSSIALEHLKLWPADILSVISYVEATVGVAAIDDTAYNIGLVVGALEELNPDTAEKITAVIEHERVLHQARIRDILRNNTNDIVAT